MKEILVYPAGTGKAVGFAETFLKEKGVPLVDHPTPEVTHLLLDTPCRAVPWELLERLPEKVTVAGGNLAELRGCQTIDFLKNEGYLAKNAAITAECALRAAGQRLLLTFRDAPALIIGWGRIGKCLGALLKDMGCPVTVAARKETDRAMLAALGYDAAAPEALPSPGRFRVVFNTAPGTLPPLGFHPGCLKIELASKPGLMGADVIQARGLPGLLAPESSGRLIADTLLQSIREGTI